MAYTIVKSDGTVLATIPDGTINTTSTSFGLPGRNYAGYGQTVDTNFVHQLENFASSSPPANPIRGQLWYNTNNSTMYVCPVDGESNALAWTSLATTSSGGSTTFDTVTVTGNVSASNVIATTNVSTETLSTTYLSTTAIANIANVNISAVANVSGTLKTSTITTGLATTAGTLTGVWTINGSAGGAAADAVILNTGGINISNSGGANLYGIKCDRYMYANGTPISFSGNYSNTNVASYLTTYNGNVGGSGLNSVFNGRTLTTGANTTTGTITGNWALSAGSRLNATYADLAERQHADAYYTVGTVVKVGGENDVTCTTEGDDSVVAGVVSLSHAFLMNADAGSDNTHPPIGLIGRLPVRVIGPINKHARIKTSSNGCAVASHDNSGFGYALETNLEENEKLVVCLITGR